MAAQARTSAARSSTAFERSVAGCSRVSSMPHEELRRHSRSTTTVAMSTITMTRGVGPTVTPASVSHPSTRRPEIWAGVVTMCSMAKSHTALTPQW